MTDSRKAIAYVAILTLMWALIPTLFYQNPPLDVVEGYAWGRDLALGYTKHPPMTAWLLELVYVFTGGRTFGAYWLSQICMALSYLGIWQLSTRVGLPPRSAFWSVVLTSFIYYFLFPTPEFNPNILQMPVWIWLVLLLHRGLDEDKLIDWLAIGVLAAFGLYSKYFVLLIIGCMGLYMLAFPAGRKLLRNPLKHPGPWLTLVLTAGLLLPHLYWLKETGYQTLTYAAARSNPPTSGLSHLTNPLNFLAGQIADHAALFIICMIGFGVSGLKRIRLHRASSPSPRFPVPYNLEPRDRHFVLWFAFAPLAVLLLVNATCGAEFKQMWGTPMFGLSGLVAVIWCRIPDAWTSERRAFATAVGLQTICLIVLMAMAILPPAFGHKPPKTAFPGHALADTMTAAWREETDLPLKYVAGDVWEAANVTLFSSDQPHFFWFHGYHRSPWLDPQDIKRSGVLIVWLGTSPNPPAPLKALYPDLPRTGSSLVPWSIDTGGAPVQINWITVRPDQVRAP